MLGVLGGVSGLCMLDGPNRESAKNVRETSSKLTQDQRIEREDITHDRQHRFLQDIGYWCAFTAIGAGRSKPARVRGLGLDCLGSGWIGSPGAAGSSANSGCDFGSILANSGFCAPRYTGGPQTTKINKNRHRSGPRTFSALRGGL